jgi:hypothetical protein
MVPPKLPDTMIADMSDRTDWGSVLTRSGDPLTVKASKLVVDAPNPNAPAPTKPTQGSTAP